MDIATMTKEEARAAIEAELFALKLRKRMALPEKIAFCESAHRRLVFQSETDRLRDILQWVEIWQSLWLPDKLASGEQVNVAVDATQQSPSNAWPGLAQIVLRIVNAWRSAAGRALVKQSAAAPQAENRFGEVMGPTAAAPQPASRPSEVITALAGPGARGD
ncbi:MAG TPA: hypothetical protein VFE01_07315 [Terracidiphilus sp.]|nr:hypothetical protein [Terracidiphilus sp.]